MISQIGQKIREARQARGISLRQLANQVGIHFSHLSKIENGKDTVGKNSLIRIAEELGVDPDLMLAEAGHTGYSETLPRVCPLRRLRMSSLSTCRRSSILGNTFYFASGATQ